MAVFVFFMLFSQKDDLMTLWRFVIVTTCTANSDNLVPVLAVISKWLNSVAFFSSRM